MIPNFALIIGAMKCGTSTLYDHLVTHPQIAAGTKKEPSFFSNDHNWKRGIGWYESQFGFDPSRHRYALDASTDYTKDPYCPGIAARITATAPREYKLIYIMRHPLRRIESHALFAELTKTEFGGRRSPYTTHCFDAGITPAAIAFSLYAYQIDRFADYYDKGDLLLLTLEQLVRDPSGVLERVCVFLGIDNLIKANTLLKSNEAASHYVPHPLWAIPYKSRATRALARAALPRLLRQKLYGVALSAAQPKGRFTLNAEEERALIAILSADLERLRDRYNVDIEREWGIVL
jgi:hypothetical protein